MSQQEAEQVFLPPPGPPPLLAENELTLLAQRGFLSVKLPADLEAEIYTLLDYLPTFYSQSKEQKTSLYPEKLGTEFGYYNIENEKEYLTLRCRSSVGGDSDLENLAASVWRQTAMFLQRILCDIARAVDLPCTVWDQIIDGTLSLPDNEEDISATLLRMFKYLPNEGFAGKHTDLGLLTLCVGTRPGLQVVARDEDVPQYVDAAGPTVLVGQTLKALSDGLILPGIHRVVPHPEGRFSVVFALRHSFKHQIDLERFGGTGSIDPKQLWEKLKIGVLNVNARKDIRDKQRKALDEMRVAAAYRQGSHGPDASLWLGE